MKMPFNLMISPLVSIITPLYNAESYISETIESVINQTYKNWEMLIVDDKSTDNSVEQVLKYVKADARIKLYKLPANNGNPYYARNYATQKATGELIAFLDSDDIWLPDKLALQVEFMNDNNYPIVFSSYKKFTTNTTKASKAIIAPKSVDYKKLLKGNSIGCLTSVYNVKLVGKIYQINHKHEDYIMWLEVLRRGFVAYGLDQVLALYRVHANSISNSKITMAGVTWRIFRNVLKQNRFEAFKNFVFYATSGFKKYLK